MLKSKKIKEIQSAPELLRINSRYKKMSDFSKNLFIAVIIIFFVAYLSICLVFLKEKGGSEQIVFISIAAFFLTMALFIFYTSNRRKGNPLIITNKGICAEPGIAEYWEDIESYTWEEFTGTLNRTDFSTSNYGICLLIYTKALFNKNISSARGLFPHSMLAQYGIFFSQDQVEETDKIFQKYGIKKKII